MGARVDDVYAVGPTLAAPSQIDEYIKCVKQDLGVEVNRSKSKVYVPSGIYPQDMRGFRKSLLGDGDEGAPEGD